LADRDSQDSPRGSGARSGCKPLREADEFAWHAPPPLLPRCNYESLLIRQTISNQVFLKFGGRFAGEENKSSCKPQLTGPGRGLDKPSKHWKQRQKKPKFRKLRWASAPHVASWKSRRKPHRSSCDSFCTKRLRGRPTQSFVMLKDASMACLVAVPSSRQVSRGRRQFSGATLPIVHGRVNNGLLG
jgi:hypothetical protein